MKYRTGFVSNSSSQSFIVSFPHQINKKKQLSQYFKDVCDEWYEDRTIPKEKFIDYFFENAELVSVENLKEELLDWETYKEIERQFSHEMHKNYTWSKASDEDKQKYNEIKEKLITDRLFGIKSFWKDRKLYAFEVEDHDWDFETIIHNSDGNFINPNADVKEMHFSHH